MNAALSSTKVPDFLKLLAHELRWKILMALAYSDDAAVVDGCNEWTAFFRVILSISGPAIASVCILEFLAAWNESFLPLILISSPELRTLPLAIQVFFYTYRTTDWGQVFAALTVGALPMILLYLFLQRLFIQGLTSGVAKG